MPALRRVLVLLALLSLGMALTGFGPAGIALDSNDPMPVSGRDVQSARELVAPELSAAAYIVTDEASGKLLLSKQEHVRRPMGSTTKIMTALLVLERAKLDDQVTVQVDAAKMPDSSVMGLVPGERLTVRELMYGLLLPSGNDAALALAQHVAGGESQFVALMNRRAADLGLANTHFDNPHGLDGAEHYSSAADLAKLTRIALQNRTFAEMVATRELTVKGSKLVYPLRNTNPILGRPGVEGVKTGQTDGAGPCLVSAIRRDGHRLIIVVLASANRADETLRLANAAFSAYAWPRYRPSPDPFSPVNQTVDPGDLGKAGVEPAAAWRIRHTIDLIDASARRVRFLLAGEPVAEGALVACPPAGCP